MKYYIVLAIVLSAQCVFVTCKNPAEVVEDFLPVFNALHYDITRDQTILYSESNNQEHELNDKVSREKELSNEFTERALAELEQYVKDTLNHYGQTESSESIQHCITEKNKEVDNLISKADEGKSDCLKPSQQAIDTLSEVLRSFYHSQTVLHYDVENVRIICEGSETAQEMHTCLTKNLYFIVKPKIEEMETKMDDLFNNNEKFLKGVSDTTVQCFDNVNTYSYYLKSRSSELFAKCVWESTVNRLMLSLM